ncbi:MAG: hypothetical protein LBH48_00545, partial [Bifidobacteriaceae bacterium]|nr:hypothetical protein [Bifidobacteriaceae bacterium]
MTAPPVPNHNPDSTHTPGSALRRRAIGVAASFAVALGAAFVPSPASAYVPPPSVPAPVTIEFCD